VTDLPTGWEWTTIGEIGEYLNGRGFKKAEWSDQGWPIIRIQNLTGSGTTFNHYRGDAEERHIVRAGDLLVSWAATLGVYVWRGPEAVLNQHIFKVQSHIDAGFHRCLLEHALADLHRQTHGSGMVHITKGNFESTPVPLPPLAEQERIVAAIEEHLSRLDAAAEALRSAEVRIEAVSAGVARELAIGSKVQWVSLGEIAEVKGGVTKDAKRQSDPTFVDVPYLRVANVQRGYLDLNIVTTIRVDPQKAAALELRNGDLLLNEGGDRDKLGRGWVWEGQIDRCIHQNHVFRARLTDDGFNPYFVSRHANTWGRSWFEQHGKQTTNLASISLTTLRQLPVPVLPRARQDEMVARLSEIDSVTARLSGALRDGDRRAKALRRSILAAAFSGRLVPQDPADEPASVLLKRIRAETASSKADKHHRAGTAAR
jgi:type I restriction enzyme S subunit